MATKKEKRAQLLAKRAKFEAEVREDGLKAQRADQQRRKVEEERAWDEAHKHHLKKNRFHSTCPRCAATKARQAIERLAKAVEQQRSTYIIDENGNRSFEPVEDPDHEIIDLSREEKAS